MYNHAIVVLLPQRDSKIVDKLQQLSLVGFCVLVEIYVYSSAIVTLVPKSRTLYQVRCPQKIRVMYKGHYYLSMLPDDSTNLLFKFY